MERNVKFSGNLFQQMLENSLSAASEHFQSLFEIYSPVYWRKNTYTGFCLT